MKALVIFGAVVGFLVGPAVGLAGNIPWSICLWRICAAAPDAGFLTHWRSRIWSDNFRDPVEQRRHQRPVTNHASKPTVKV